MTLEKPCFILFSKIIKKVELEYIRGKNPHTEDLYGYRNKGFEEALDNIKKKFMTEDEIIEFDKLVEKELDDDGDDDEKEARRSQLRFNNVIKDIISNDDEIKKIMKELFREILKEEFAK